MWPILTRVRYTGLVFLVQTEAEFPLTTRNTTTKRNKEMHSLPLIFNHNAFVEHSDFATRS